MIFIDSGAIIARLVTNDQYHAAATAFWDELGQRTIPCFTSNIVLSESFTVVARRAGYKFAADQAKQLYSSQVLEILRPSHRDESQAVLLFEKYANQSVSFADCVSFVLLKRRGIRDVFGMDQHFVMAGFRLLPEIGKTSPC